MEIKPILFAPEDIEEEIETMQDTSCINTSNCWGFQHESWHEECIKKCLIRRELCSVLLCVTNELRTKICFDPLDAGQSKGNSQNFTTEGQMGEVSRFCVYLLDKVVMENGFSWNDMMVGSLCLIIS